MRFSLTTLLGIAICQLAFGGKVHGDPVRLEEGHFEERITHKVTITNGTESLVKGLVVVFDTGGTIGDATLTMNAAGAGMATISGSGDRITITWSELGLVHDAQIMFTFTTDLRIIRFLGGVWIVGGPDPEIPVDPVRDKLIVQEIPEPTTLFLLSSGLAGIAIKTRKRAVDSDA